MVVFVVGGITRSEMRAAHKLSAKLARPVLLGGTALDSPGTFLKRLSVRLCASVCLWNCSYLCWCNTHGSSAPSWQSRCCLVTQRSTCAALILSAWACASVAHHALPIPCP